MHNNNEERHSVDSEDSSKPIIEIIRAWDRQSELHFPEELSDSPTKFAPGLFNRVRFLHGPRTGDELPHSQAIELAIEELQHLACAPDSSVYQSLSEKLRGTPVVSIIDELLEQLKKEDWATKNIMALVARRMLMTAKNSNVLKLGIALTGAYGDEAELEIVTELALHDEFTLFCAVAVQRLAKDYISRWQQMANRVDGWGKVHLVQRLCKVPRPSQQLKSWLLRQGYKNTILVEYVAWDCAKSGNLKKALETQSDSELVTGACEMLCAMINGCPGKTVDEYRDAPIVAERLVSLIDEQQKNLKRLYFLERLESLLSTHEKQSATGGNFENQRGVPNGCGFSRQLRQSLRAKCDRILNTDDARNRVLFGYSDNSTSEQWLAWKLAPRTKVDLWAIAFERFLANPHGCDYFQLLDISDETRLALVFDIVEEMFVKVPESMAFIKKPREFNLVCAVLSKMKQRGPISELLIQTAIESTDYFYRNIAYLVIEARDYPWSQKIKSRLEQNLPEETNNRIRLRLEQCISRLTLSE